LDLGLNDRTALVMGAGGGLGGAIAATLAAEGARVAVADIDLAAAERTASAIAARGGRALPVAWDLADLGMIAGNLARIEAELGPVDVLVNNTGGPPPTPVAGQDPAQWSKHFGAMVLSVIAITDAVLPGMRARGDGILIHTASGAGRWVSLLSGPGYTAAKHGMVAMSHQLNMSECIHGIRSMVICPGEIATPILENRPIPLTRQELDRMLKPEDVADLMLYAARLPRHVNLNEVVMLPAWNRAYVAALAAQARERDAKSAPASASG